MLNAEDSVLSAARLSVAERLSAEMSLVIVIEPKEQRTKDKGQFAYPNCTKLGRERVRTAD